MKKWFLSLLEGEQHRTSNDEAVCDLAIGRDGVDEVEVGDTGEALRQLASTVGESSERSTSGLATGNKSTGRSLRGRIAHEVQVGVGNESLVGIGHGDGGERGQDQVAARGARADKGRGEREDLLGRQRRVEEIGRRGDARDGADEALVASLDGEDGGGRGEDGRHRDDGGGAEVGGHADLLQDGGGLDHGLGRGQGGAKVVLARYDGLDAHLSQRTLDDADVGLLRCANVDKVVDLGLREAKIEELLLGDGSEALLVEGGLEILES